LRCYNLTFLDRILYVYQGLLTGITYPYVRNKFKGMSTEVKLEDAIEFAFNFSLFGLSIGPVSSLGVSIRPIQVREEITKLLQILKQKSPDSVLEIGKLTAGLSFYSHA
jgi:hypothetical protein